MRDRNLVALGHARHYGGSHAAQPRVFPHSLEHTGVGHAKRGHQPVRRPGVVLVVGMRPGAVVFLRMDDELGDGVDRDAGRDLAGGVAAHAVGNKEELRLVSDEERILVVLTLASDIGEAVSLHFHSHLALFALPQFGQCRLDFNIVPIPL